MKRTHLVIQLALMAVLGSSAVLVTGCTGSKSDTQAAQKTEKAVKYTCSMDPDVFQDRPGNCPKCGMALVEKR